ncbi:hypothetical protein XENOCAPTIV_019307, partial [Xenoophorus captivus]
AYEDVLERYKGTSQELGGMVSGYLHFDLKVFSLLAMLSDDVPLPVSSCFVFNVMKKHD